MLATAQWYSAGPRWFKPQ